METITALEKAYAANAQLQAQLQRTQAELQASQASHARMQQQQGQQGPQVSMGIEKRSCNRLRLKRENMR